MAESLGVKCDEVDTLLYASIVHTCILKDKLSKIKASLRKISKGQRHKIVSHRVAGHAALFSACLHGKVHIAKYLLEECGANIEQTGTYEEVVDHSTHEVTPLWCASVANRLEVVKMLIEHGANINSTSDTGSTPVRSACYMTNFSIVKLLVDNGADIHKPNINGGTCLINSVQNVQLCEFLIKKGVDVNAQDNSGNLALHYAIREGQIDTVKLLLKYNSDFSLKNDFGDDALQTASLRGSLYIVQYLLENTPHSRESAAHAYELLGAFFIDENHNTAVALNMWQKAMTLRYEDPDDIIHKKLPTETISACKQAREPTNMSELMNIRDPDEIYMQALLIRERILGPFHKDTTFGLMYRGAVYADSHHYQRCVDLWKYAYILRHRKGEPLSHDCLFTAQALVKLFWEMQVELESSGTDERVNILDGLEVLKMLTQQIEGGMKLIKDVAMDSPSMEDFQLLLQLSLHVIHLLSRLEGDDDQKLKYYSLVHALVMLDPRGQNKESLLHLAIDPKISLTSDEFFSPFPSLAVVQVLLYCGADINAVDVKKNTPLHNSLSFLTYSELQNEGILGCLLQNGAHIDTYNAEGVSCLRLIENQGLPVFPLQYRSLKCFAAEVIMKMKIPYENEVPVSLFSFIKLHG